MATSTHGLRSQRKSRQAPARQRSGTHETVGVIGLGIMGSAMAANLVRAGFRVAGYDVAPDALRQLKRAGGEPLKDVRGVADAAATIITSLPSASALIQVVTELAAGPKGPRRRDSGADL
jgi:3-hydroxyisobutyrate dehydrogenase-like beta-hydroxyacid dehydrogenase